MPEDGVPDVLSMMQLSDSMFPAGTFALSNGIESMHLAGRIQTASDLEGLTSACIEHQVGPFDCVAAVTAHRYAGAGRTDLIRTLDARCLSMKPVREAREASVRSGTQLARCAGEFLGDDGVLGSYLKDVSDRTVSGVYPVSFGVCCRALEISRERTAMTLLYGFVAANMGAALRLGIIQHYEAQGIIHRLKPAMARAAGSSCSADGMWQFCPQAEIAQMAHEDLDSKMFIT